MPFRLPSLCIRLATIPVVLLILLHMASLRVVPPLYIDEVATSVHIQAMLSSGADFNGDTLPLMSASFGGGYTTSTYLYPLVGWSSVFGTSDLAIRAFSQVVTIITILLIAASLHLWLGKRAGYIGLLVGLTLPWAWINGLLAWDPAITPLYLAIGFFLFSLLATRTWSSLQRIGLVGLLTVALVLTAYSYPPARVGAPLLLFGALIYLARYRSLGWREAATITIVGAITSLPLLSFLLTPEALERSASLNVFHDTSLLRGAATLLSNLAGLLNPIPLFFTGDANLRHSTTRFGMLGTSALIALLALAWKVGHQVPRKALSSKIKQLLTISVVGVLVSFLGSALTSEGQPHYLRAVTAWPFFVILITIGWLYVHKLPDYWHQLLVLFGALLVSCYIFDLTTNYPIRAESAFGAEARTERELEFLEAHQSR